MKITSLDDLLTNAPQREVTPVDLGGVTVFIQPLTGWQENQVNSLIMRSLKLSDVGDDLPLWAIAQLRTYQAVFAVCNEQGDSLIQSTEQANAVMRAYGAKQISILRHAYEELTESDTEEAEKN